jgi:hypothetical protein
MNLGTEISTVVIKDPPVPGKKVVFLSNYPLVFALSPSSTAGSHRSLCDTDVPGVQWDRAFASKVIVTAPPPKQNAEKGPSGAGFTSSRNVCSYRCAREKIPIPPPCIFFQYGPIQSYPEGARNLGCPPGNQNASVERDEATERRWVSKSDQNFLRGARARKPPRVLACP